MRPQVIALFVWATLPLAGCATGRSDTVDPRCKTEPGCLAGMGTCYKPDGCRTLVCLCDRPRATEAPEVGALAIALDLSPAPRGTPDSPSDSGPRFQYIAVSESGIELLGVQIHYEPAKPFLHGDASPVLAEIARALRARPERSLRIEVHTDNPGSPELNLELSRARAEATKARLVEFGVEPERLLPIGHGESRPISHPSPGKLGGRTEFRWAPSPAPPR